MSTSDYDQFRPPEPERRRRRGFGGGKRRRGGSTARVPADSMVPEVEFTSYYGRNVVKPPPWEWPVALYLFTGGVAGASGVLAAGAQIAGLPVLRRNTRLAALAAVGVSGAALVADLGRPERALNMLRTFKVTSPTSVGSWILTAFSAPTTLAAVAELPLPLGRLRKVVDVLQGPAGLAAGAFGPPLAGYTAVLLADTAIPTWNGARQHLPFVFVSSASLAASGLAMITTPTDETGPARRLAVLGVVGDLVAMRVMEAHMDPVVVEPLHEGKPGKLLHLSERLAIAGGIGALFARRRWVAVASGLALMAASACTRFGVFEAGLESAKDPRYTVVPQRRRLEERRRRGEVDDSITTVE